MPLQTALIAFRTKRFMAMRKTYWKKRMCQGQATVEFAIVMVALLSLIAGLGALSDFGQSGVLVEHACAGASHTVGGQDAGAWADVLAY